jgi:hypothetical protein
MVAIFLPASALEMVLVDDHAHTAPAFAFEIPDHSAAAIHAHIFVGTYDVGWE